MLTLTIVLECEVEDEEEAKAKARAAFDVLAVYPFIKVSAEITGQIPIKGD